jgi:hypothetical protein
MTITMWENTFTMNDIIKKLHENGVSGRMDFRKVKFTLCDGWGEPFLKVEYPQAITLDDDMYW